MAINRKGMRKIVVDGDLYHYKIRMEETWYTPYLVVVFETPEGKVHTCNIERESYYDPFTPKDTAELIRETVGV